MNKGSKNEGEEIQIDDLEEAAPKRKMVLDHYLLGE